MVDLPMDRVYTCILPRLPARSLLRFKCVSKSFKALISSPNFIDLQHRHSLSSKADRLIVLTNSRDGLYICNLHDDPSPPYHLPYPEFTYRYGLVFSIVASCQCFVLIGYGFTQVTHLALINPSTGSYREALCLNQSLRSNGHCDYYGLGYDEKNGDYKIVKLRDHPFSNESSCPRDVLIYSFNSDSWRWVDDMVVREDRVESKTMSDALINNHLLHWTFRSCDEESANTLLRIGCFDVCKEQWVNDVPLPESLIKSNEISRSDIFVDVVVFEECLCFLVDNKDDDTFDVWIMNEYGVQSSWYKLVAVPNSCFSNPAAGIIPSLLSNIDMYPMVYPIAFRTGSRNEILFNQNWTSELFWYNIRDQVLTTATEFDGVPDCNCEVYMCKGSLSTTVGASQFRAESRGR